MPSSAAAIDTDMDADIDRRLAAASPGSFWLDRSDGPSAAPPLAGRRRTDLAVIGGGYSGLWTALLARRADPGRDVVLIEAETIGWAASGRNGGFCDASLTHGEANGRERFPGEIDRLDQLGRENLDSIEAFVTGAAAAGASASTAGASAAGAAASAAGASAAGASAAGASAARCGWERTGSLTVATASVAAAADPTLHRPGLRPRPGHGAARGCRPGVDRLGAAPRRLRRWEPLPLLPADRRQPHSLGTRWSIARADEREGRRNAWLRTLDRLGLGFDS